MPDSPIVHVTHLVSSPQRRGAQLFAVELAAALVDLGIRGDVVAVAPTDEPGPLPVPVAGPGGLGPRAVLALRRRVAVSDIVVAHGSRGLPAAAACSVLGGPPFVYRNIGDPAHWQLAAGRRWRVRTYLGRARAVAALAPRMADVLVRELGVRADRVVVVPNAVDHRRVPPVDPIRRAVARAALGLGDDTLVVAAASSITPEKRLEDLVTAAGGIPGAVVVVAGSGPGAGSLAALAARLGVDLRLIGVVADPVPVLHAADLVALPSVTEGMPGLLIEAGLAGLPVVATDVGAVSDIVRDGVTGRLVAPGDVAALRSAVLEVARRPELGIAGREHCLARFTFDTVAPAYAALLTGAAGGG